MTREIGDNVEITGTLTVDGASTLTGDVTIAGLIINPGGIKIQSADVTKNANVTFADLTGLSVNVLAGKTYIVRAVLYVTVSAAAGAKFQFGGTSTVTSGLDHIYVIEAANNTTVAFSAKATPKTLGGFQNASVGLEWVVHIDATIVVNAGGTLTLQFAQQVSNASNCTVKAASMMEVRQVS